MCYANAMTQPDYSDPIFTGMRLAEAVGAGDGSSVRQISAAVESDFIQHNGEQTFITAFIALNSLDGADFPHDVWGGVTEFLMKDIKDRSVILGCSEDVLHGMVGSFLSQNVQASIEGEEPKILNPDGYTAGYFMIASSIGEAVYALFRVAGEKRFGGDTAKFKELVAEHFALQLAIREAEEAE